MLHMRWKRVWEKWFFFHGGENLEKLMFRNTWYADVQNIEGMEKFHKLKHMLLQQQQIYIYLFMSLCCVQAIDFMHIMDNMVFV